MSVLVLLIFISLLGFFFLLTRRQGVRHIGLREVETWKQLPNLIGAAVESGRRLHLSLGHGVLGQPDTATLLAGLNAVGQIATVTVVSDKPPVITTTDGATALLAQDLVRQAYRQQNAAEQYRDDVARVAGLSPLSFNGALTAVVRDEAVAGSIFIGSAGPEVVLLTEAGRQAGAPTFAGSDNIAGQAVLFAAADQTLLGEDVYSAGAYLGRMPAHIASLHTQDVMRWLIVGAMLVGILWTTVQALMG
ncbi:MAG: hypothetical protein RMK99_04820 [Anaerolineales bacterium]|nr:hypothetical protein [Anaerolineales bacterium]